MIARLRRRPWRNIVLPVATIAVCALAFGSARDWAGFAAFAARATSVAAAPAFGPSRPVVWAFPYRGIRMTLCTEVPESTLAQERSLPTAPVFMSGGRLREAYMTTLVRTQALTPLVGELTRQLRTQRAGLRLDDDEYMEMIAHAVQSIPYGGGGTHVRSVAETLVDGEGVCTDKSVLLAALLVHEGYDTALWVFDSQGHVAVGVRGAGPGLHGSGYALVETTRIAYVDEVDGRLLVTGGATRAPQLVRIGGSRRYLADVESDFIVATLERARLTDLALAPYTRIATEGATGRWARTYAGLAVQHQETTRFAAWLAAGSDRRAAIFATLTK
jgi:hypothetical protein